MDIEEFGTQSEEQEEKTSELQECYDNCDKYKSEPENGLVGNICQWQVLPNNQFTSSAHTIKMLPPGIYNIYIDSYGKFYFNLKNICSDSFINFEDSQLDNILKDINEFWDIADKFLEYGFMHRRGILLYGPAGSGKSILVKQACAQIIKQEGIVVEATTCKPDYITEAVNIVRKIEPEKNMIVIFEDIDAYIHKFGESEVLSFLDGEDSSNHLLCIATTNYPEKLDKRIVARPRRFDRIIKIGMPTKQMRETYFKIKLNVEGKELQKYVDASEGFSFAAMTELVISTKCFNKDFDESITLLKSILLQRTSSEEYYSEKVGFGK